MIRYLTLALLMAGCADAYPDDSAAEGGSIIVRQVDIVPCEPSDDGSNPLIEFDLEVGEEMPTVLKCAGDTCQLVTTAIVWQIADVTAPDMEGTVHVSCDEAYTYRFVRLIPLD